MTARLTKNHITQKYYCCKQLVTGFCMKVLFWEIFRGQLQKTFPVRNGQAFTLLSFSGRYPYATQTLTTSNVFQGSDWHCQNWEDFRNVSLSKAMRQTKLLLHVPSASYSPSLSSRNFQYTCKTYSGFQKTYFKNYCSMWINRGTPQSVDSLALWRTIYFGMHSTCVVSSWWIVLPVILSSWANWWNLFKCPTASCWGRHLHLP